MDETVLLRIGRVIKTHGVVGAILVAPDSEDPTRLLELKSVGIGASPNRTTWHDVTGSSLHHVKKHTGIVFHLQNIDAIEQAQSLVGSNVYVPETELPALDDGSFFLDDLRGLQVKTIDGQAVGRIREWRDYPSQVMLVIESDSKESLVPLVIPEIVSEIDLENGVVTLENWEGLIDG